MDGSSSQSCDHFSQSLPTVEALDLNNNNDNHSDVVSDKQLPMASAVVTNKSDVTGKSTDDKSCGSVASSRNGKDVMLPGNQETPAAVDEAQKLPDEVSLPYVDNGVDDSSSHHQNGGKHRASSKRPSRKMSQQQQDNNVNHPVRVTRSTSKMMAAQVTTGNSEAPNKRSDHSKQDVEGDDIKPSNGHGQLKYNKSGGFSATTNSTNWTGSEMNSIFTNNGTKYNGDPCSSMNSDVNKGSHTVGHILNDSLLPLQDVTNSSSNSDTIVAPKPQPRVYDLVAGKKSKKGKRQLRKTVQVPHKKKLNTSEANETSTSTTEEQLDPVSTNDNKSVTHVKDITRLSHSRASGHSRNSRELVCEYKCCLYKA